MVIDNKFSIGQSVYLKTENESEMKYKIIFGEFDKNFAEAKRGQRVFAPKCTISRLDESHVLSMIPVANKNVLPLVHSEEKPQTFIAGDWGGFRIIAEDVELKVK